MSGRDALVLAGHFTRRGQPTLRVLAAGVGAMLAVAIYAVLALSVFLGHVSDRGQARDFGPLVADGCIQGTFRYDSLGTTQYTNYLVADSCGTADPPPGLSSFPAPGQVFVSPALDALRASDERVATRFPQVDGLIGADGLTGSNELFSISGVPPVTGDLPVGTVAFDRFGSSNDYLTNYLRFDRLTLVVIGLVFTLLPAAFLIYATTRLTARMRERQTSLLAIMGVEESALCRALTLEACANVAVGAAVGTLAAAVFVPRATPSFVTWTAFPGDFSAPIAYMPVIVLLVLVLAAAAAYLGSKGAAQGNLGPRRSFFGSVRTRWAIFIAGVALGSVSIWFNSDAAWPVVLLGRIATFIGLILIAAPLCASAGERLHRSVSAVPSIIGARLRNPAGSLTRALGALAAGLFLLSAGLTTVNVLAENPQAIAQQYASDGNSVIEIRRPSAELRDAVRDYQVLAGTSSSDTPGVSGVLRGPCNVISTVVGGNVSCGSPELFGAVFEGQTPPQGSSAQAVTLAGPRAEALSSFILQVTTQPELQDGDSLILVPLPADEAAALYDRLVGADPANNVRIVGSSQVSGASELSGILDVFRLGALFAVMVAFLAVLVSFVALLHDRRPGSNFLEIMGVPSSQARSMLLQELIAGSSPVLLASLFSSWIWALSLQSGDRQASLITVAAPYVLAFIATIGAAAMIALLTKRRDSEGIAPDRDGLAAAHDVFEAAH